MPGQSRQGFEAMSALFPVADDIRTEPVRAGGVPCEWISAPEASPRRVVLYLHGGGYMIGSINTHRDLVSRISRASGARGLSVDYRLGPEHPFPAAVEDATSAYRWLLGQGFEPQKIAIAGDSAGGGLALATLVALRDARDPLPAAGVLISPWTDLARTGESMQTRASEDPILQPEALERFADAYLGASDPKQPLASPLYADLGGLPPLLVHVGTREILFDDAARVADKTKAAGVEVTFEPWDGMIHIWHIFAPMVPEGQQAIDRVGEYLRAQLR